MTATTIHPPVAPDRSSASTRERSERPSGSRRLRLAFAGGGTGGHVVPGVHLLRFARTCDDALRPEGVLWFGAGRRTENRALRGLREFVDGGFEKVDLVLEPPGGGAPRPVELLRRVTPAFRTARSALRRARSDVVCGLGGFTSLPVVLAAKSLGLPVALLEVNAVSGRATRWLAPLADKVFHAWPTSVPDHAKHDCVGPPLGPGFVAPPFDREARYAVKRELGFEGDRELLLVLGGSQGAHALNRIVRDRAEELLAQRLSILHQVGPGRDGEGRTKLAGYRSTEYLDGVDRVLRAADVVLTRGGASTLAEIGAAGTPAVVVPYPHHADRHQRRNALAIGGDVVVVEEAEGEEALLAALFATLHEVRRGRPGVAASGRVPTHGARRLFDELRLLSAKRVSHD